MFLLTKQIIKLTMNLHFSKEAAMDDGDTWKGTAVQFH